MKRLVTSGSQASLRTLLASFVPHRTAGGQHCEAKETLRDLKTAQNIIKYYLPKAQLHARHHKQHKKVKILFSLLPFFFCCCST